MEYVFLGRTGVRVSALALGTMSFGGESDRSAAKQMFAAARDAGINFFDCADVYNNGAAETILGELIVDCRDEVVITSKAYFPTSSDVNARGASRLHLMRAVDASLKRLATDRIDVFFLHRHDDVTAIDETLRAMEDLARQGKILYPAASNFSAWQTSRALGVARAEGFSPMVCVQPMYNVVKRQAEVEILPMAQAEGLAVMPYGPTAGGLLAGRYRGGKRPQAGRLVDNPMYRTRYADEDYYQAADKFVALAAELQVHPVSLAVAWVAAHPAVTSPLIGGRNLEQIAPALESTNVSMDSDLYARIAALWPAPAPATDRNEEQSANNYGSR